MTQHSQTNQLLDPAEIERAINRAKVLRAETFRACFRAFIGFVRTLQGFAFSSVRTFKSSGAWKESSRINAR
jgi:hypothetical protein